uniref:Uncharacterized protein n=1 Tax=Meloidogyne incognita TaxID=6306 RepID=A0A914L5M6_MELIC
MEIKHFNTRKTSFCKLQIPSLFAVTSSEAVRHFGRIRASNPDISNSRFELSLLYTETNEFGTYRLSPHALLSFYFPFSFFP